MNEPVSEVIHIRVTPSHAAGLGDGKMPRYVMSLPRSSFLVYQIGVDFVRSARRRPSGNSEAVLEQPDF